MKSNVQFWTGPRAYNEGWGAVQILGRGKEPHFWCSKRRKAESQSLTLLPCPARTAVLFGWAAPKSTKKLGFCLIYPPSPRSPRIWSDRGGSTSWKAQSLPFRPVRDYVHSIISRHQSRLPLSVSF